MRADTAWDAADSPASRCSAHKTVGARADAAAIDVSRKKWRRDGAELITFFIVQPCDGARRRASAVDGRSVLGRFTVGTIRLERDGEQALG